MPLFIATPYRIIRPEPRIDPMSKQLVQDPPYRVYTKRDENELYQLWKQQDGDIIEVTETHAQQVLRKQKGYQEIPVTKFEARSVKKHLGAKRNKVNAAPAPSKPTTRAKTRATNSRTSKK